jgi:cytochrome b561
MKTRPARWSGGVIALHWLSAAWLALVFTLGLTATRATLDAARKFDLYQAHKALGWLTLALLAARLAARAVRAAPPPGPSWSRATRAASRLVHAALYAVLAAVPLIGWLRVSSAIVPIPVSLFGLATIPNIAPVDADFSDAMALAHKLGAWSLAALVVVHAAAALKHQFIDRDSIFARMWPRRTPPADAIAGSDARKQARG